MEISSTQIKELRDQTGISVMQCKKALEEADGDMAKALVILKKKRSEAAEKKSDRELGAGTIGVYVHNTNEVAAFVKLASETDFVSKNEEFVKLANDIAMHVAAMNPKYIARDEVDAEAMEAAKAVFAEEVKDKPAEMQEKIMEGKLAAYFKDQILLEQPFVKNPDMTIGEMVSGAVQKFGENVTLVEVQRMSIKG
ncbi:elongation factor Ts [Candidatus Kaiserbacteria bacterium]|nr:elongation factor Ts [Candidatus Kaiserbacteria bacterium]MCB9811730.1 elongation factor Ts [Candidatus Nomurabacteria bacterium]